MGDLSMSRNKVNTSIDTKLGLFILLENRWNRSPCGKSWIDLVAFSVLVWCASCHSKQNTSPHVSSMKIDLQVQYNERFVRVHLLAVLLIFIIQWVMILVHGSKKSSLYGGG